MVRACTQRTQSVLAFSFLFSYLMAFLFEGRLLYALLAPWQENVPLYVGASIAAHCGGLLAGAFFIKTAKCAKRCIVASMSFCLVAAVPFFFPPSFLWLPCLVLSSFVCGMSIASWGWCLKAFTPQGKRLKSCAEMLIGSNLLMLVLNSVSAYVSPSAGLLCALSFVFAGLLLVGNLPTENTPCSLFPSFQPSLSAGTQGTADIGDVAGTRGEQENALSRRLASPAIAMEMKRALCLLVAFTCLLTLNAGVMYRIVNPAFAHIPASAWFWAVPYMVAIFAMRIVPRSFPKALSLHLGFIMMTAAFVAFMALAHGEREYFLVNTLLLGACGLFDIFWWSIMGDMIEYSPRPAKIFGIGLSANILGVLLGGMLGNKLMQAQYLPAEIAVFALAIICITLVIFPLLQTELSVLLKNHSYLLQIVTLLQQPVAVEHIAGEAQKERADTAQMPQQGADDATGGAEEAGEAGAEPYRNEAEADEVGGKGNEAGAEKSYPNKFYPENPHPHEPHAEKVLTANEQSAETALAGESLEDSIGSPLHPAPAPVQENSLITSLTTRERDVLRCILAGNSNKDIGAELHITENTVKSHVRNIFAKANVSSRAALMHNLLQETH